MSTWPEPQIQAISMRKYKLKVSTQLFNVFKILIAAPDEIIQTSK